MTATFKSSYSNESKITSLTMHPSSVIYVPLTFQSIEEFVTSLVQASPANHIPMPVIEKDQRTTGTSGPIPSDALARWDQVTQSWKTSQASFLTDTPALLPGSFPKSGMTRNGVLYRQPMLVRPISERDGGAWPTPVADDTGTRKKKYAQGGTALSMDVQQWPTPKSQDSKHGPLTEWEKNTNHPGTKDSLRYKVMMKWPTPTVSDAKGSGPAIIRKDGKSRMDRLDYATEQDATSLNKGSLNPNWVSWLMGIPTGWDSLEPMDRNAYDEWFEDMRNDTWWNTERDLPRVATGKIDRAKRLRALGNGIVPASLALFLNQATLLPYLENPQG